MLKAPRCHISSTVDLKTFRKLKSLSIKNGRKMAREIDIAIQEYIERHVKNNAKSTF